MSSIKFLLNELLNKLTSKSYQIEDRFEDGISNEEIFDALKNSELTLPEEVFDIYNWKNGLSEKVLLDNDLGHLWLIPFGIFISFEDSVKAYQSNVSMSFWDKNLFPLFESGGGEYILIDCDQSSETFKMLLSYSPQEIDIVTIYDSLDMLLESTIQCFSTGIYYYDNEGYFNIDYMKQRELLKVLNPNSNYCKSF